MSTLRVAPAIQFYEGIDGRRLAVRVWSADGLPRAQCVFLHGITSHGGWYEQVAIHLRDAGIDVHFLDRRGSGLNSDQPGDVKHWRMWVEDVRIYLKRIRSSVLRSGQEQLPVVLCGISWGGKLASAIARLCPDLLEAVALICPGIYSPYLPSVLKRAVLALPVPRRLKRMRLKIPLDRPELFTTSLHWQQFIAEDPLALRTVTWRFAQEDRRLTNFARRSAPFIHRPLLMMLAGQDRIVDNESTRRFFADVGGPRKTLIEYPAAAHTLEFEPDSERYFADLTDWVLKVTQPQDD